MVRRIQLLTAEREAAVAHHYTLREVCLGQHDGAELLEHLDQNCIFARGIECAADVSERGVIAADIKLVFQSDGDAV